MEENIFEATEIVNEENLENTFDDAVDDSNPEINIDGDANDFVEKLVSILISATIATALAVIVKNWKKIRKWHLENVVKRTLAQKQKAENKNNLASAKLEKLIEKMKKTNDKECVNCSCEEITSSES